MEKLNFLNSDEVVALSTKVEEAARSTQQGVKYFIEPAQGTLRRACSRRHHIIFGRRGSGKSSLLRKAVEDLTIDRRPIALINLETFKAHSYPDILLSVLISTFDEFKQWLETAGIHPATRLTFWKRLFSAVPTRPSFNRKRSATLVGRLGVLIEELKKQLHSAENISVKTTVTEGIQSSSNEKIGAGIGVPRASASAESSTSKEQSHALQTEEEFCRDKIDFLHRHIMDYQHIFTEMAELSGGDAFLFLDDLYQVKRPEQPLLIDYFHRIAKDHNLWLKIGTIRHRTNWYVHGNPPIGIKLGDDADHIDLDLTLEKYDLAKDFLMRILNNFAKEVGVDLNKLVTEGARDRLILTSGGVARDFLSIFRRSIDFAQERRGGRTGDAIGVEDVNNAAGEHDTTKRDEFKRDASDDDRRLDSEFQSISKFCMESANSNCFLLDKDLKGNRIKLIHELVDLKLLHLVRSRVTLKSGRAGKIYEAYMLDVSQYVGARKRRGLPMIEFWKSDAEENLRRNSLVYEIA